MLHTTLVPHVNKSYAPQVACKQPSPFLLCSSHSPDHTHFRVFLPVALLSEVPHGGAWTETFASAAASPWKADPEQQSSSEQLWLGTSTAHTNINKKSYLDSSSAFLMVCYARCDFLRKLLSICHHHLYIH